MVSHDESQNAGQGAEGSPSRRGLFDMERDQACDRLNDVSAVVREAVQKLGGESVASRLAAKLADSIDRAGEYVQTAEPRDLVRDTQEFARRRPETFLAGAFLAGAAVGRFLRSHPDEGSDTPAQTDQMSDQAPRFENDAAYAAEVDRGE